MSRARCHAGLAVLLAGVLLLAGCGTGGKPGSGDRITLTMLTHYANPPLQPGLQKLVDEWNRSHPKVHVRTQAVNFDSLLETLTVRQAAGRSADIIQPYGLWAGQLAKAGVLAAAPRSVATEVHGHYSPAAVGAASVDDTVYGYPTEVQTYSLYYNKRLFAKAGITHPPHTWHQLRVDAEKTTVRDKHGNTHVQGFGVSKDQDSNVVHPFLSLLQAAGGSFLTRDGTHSAVDSSAGRAALGLERGLIDKHATEPGIDVIKAFPSGQVAMTINAGWWLGSLRSTMGKAYKNVGVAKIPGPAPGQRGSLAYGYFMGVNSKSQHAAQSWRFLRWLNAGHQPKASATRMGAFQYSVGTIPPRPADVRALTSGDSDPNLRPFANALQYAVPEPNIAHGQQIKSLLQVNIESAWTGQATPRGALDKAAQQVDHLLAR